jgi:hypothetical protein
MVMYVSRSIEALQLANGSSGGIKLYLLMPRDVSDEVGEVDRAMSLLQTCIAHLACEWVDTSPSVPGLAGAREHAGASGCAVSKVAGVAQEATRAMHATQFVDMVVINEALGAGDRDEVGTHVDPLVGVLLLATLKSSTGMSGLVKMALRRVLVTAADEVEVAGDGARRGCRS